MSYLIFSIQNMGVKGYLKFLLSNAPNVKGTLTSSSPAHENLYIDLNSMIYYAFKKINFKSDLPNEEFTQVIVDKIDGIIKFAKPSKNIFIALDGVAPASKIAQGRSRRYAYASSFVEGSFDTVNISPGTPFMIKLDILLRQHIIEKVKQEPNWSKPKLYYSDFYTPGEGEYKIMDFIRSRTQMSDYEQAERTYIYSVDTDIIFLSLGTHKQNITIIFEPQTGTDYSLFYISKIREFIFQQFDPYVKPDFERIIDDYVFLTFMFQNDFFAGFNELDFASQENDSIISNYRTARRILGGFIVNDYDINIELLKKYIDCLINSNKISESLIQNSLVQNPQKIVDDTLKTFMWMQQYYKKGCPDWHFAYEYPDPPPIHLFVKLVREIPNAFEKNSVVPMAVQLLLSVPPKSIRLLPEELHYIVENHPEAFPTEYEVRGDIMHQRALLPPMKLDLMMQEFEKSKFSEKEHPCNEIHHVQILSDGKFIDAQLPEPKPFEPIEQICATFKVEKTTKAKLVFGKK